MTPDRSHPVGRAASLANQHRGGLLSLAFLLGLVAWLTSTEIGGVRWDLVVLVAGLGLAYMWVQATDRLTRDRTEDAVFLLGVVGSISVMGFLTNWNATYLVFVGIQALVFGLFALGLNLEYGFTGIINFGHVAFMGMGAYTMAIAANRWLPGMAAAIRGTGTLGILSLGLTALLAFLLFALVGSLAAERVQARRGTPAHEDPGTPLRVGVVVGLVAAVALVVAVPWPLGTMWADALALASLVVLGMVLAGLLAVVLGIPTLRLREDYLAIVTIGAAEILRRIWLNEQWLTGGARGITAPLPFAEAPQQWAWLRSASAALGVRTEYKLLLLLLTLAAVTLTYGLAQVLVKAPYGRVLKAIREDEEVAESLGKNVFLYKVQSLVVGSMVAAVSGALLAWQNIFFTPGLFIPLYTFYAWIIVVMGGLGSNRGAILGALVLFAFLRGTSFLDLAEHLPIRSTASGAFRLVIIGILLILFMMFKPEGIMGRREEMVLGD